MFVDIVNSGISVNVKQEYVNILLAVMSMLLFVAAISHIFLSLWCEVDVLILHTPLY